jgi:hypothetical protein
MNHTTYIKTKDKTLHHNQTLSQIHTTLISQPQHTFNPFVAYDKYYLCTFA